MGGVVDVVGVVDEPVVLQGVDVGRGVEAE